MNAIIQGLNAYAGLFSFLIVVIGAFFTSKAMNRHNISEETNKAQNDAIAAMQGEIASLRRKVEDLNKDKIRLEQTIDTICAALKIRGMVITIQGELIHIEDKNGKTTTTRIHNSESNGAI
jgi:uncharacterized protein YPO0396